jgi:cytochrome c-type biogenesis protein CcmE
MGKGAQIAIAALAVFAGAAWVLSLRASGEGTFSYYENVASYLDAGSSRDAAASRRGQRVHGFVVEGSIRKDLEARNVEFRIADADSARFLEVRYEDIDVPDLFRDGAEVVVEGRAVEGTFVAYRVMAKCPSKYEVEPGAEA